MKTAWLIVGLLMVFSGGTCFGFGIGAIMHIGKTADDTKGDIYEKEPGES